MRGLLILFCLNGFVLGCQKGIKVPSTKSCQNYTECVDGRLVTKTCQDSMEFDIYTAECVKKGTGKCIQSIAQEALSVQEECSGSWKQPYKGDCQKYVECYNGHVKISSCSVMMRFDSQKLECRFGWFVRCEDTSHAPKENFCKEYERVAIVRNEQEYDECLHGNWVRQKCLFNRLFNPATATCEKKAPTTHLLIMGYSCKNGAKRGLKETCDAYGLCVNRTWTEVICPKGQRFDGIDMKCVPTLAARCFNASCTEHDLVPDPDDCGKYQECTKGKYIIQKCNWLRRFDVKTMSCTWRWKAECQSSGKKPGGGGKVHFCSNGTVVPIPGKCKDYMLCNPKDGKESLVKCGMCKNFDPALLQCVWKWKYNCQEITTEAPKPTEAPTTAPTTPSQTHSTTPEIHCTKKGDKKTAPDVCWYYECDGKLWQKKKCSKLHTFNPKKLTCTFSWSWC